MVYLKRIGLVLATTVASILMFAVLAGVWNGGKHMLEGGEFDDSYGRELGEMAGWFGFSWGGGLGALCGAFIGQDEAKTPQEKQANIVGWVVAIPIAAFCFWRLFNPA